MQQVRRFKTDTSGATAVIFGLALLPVMGLVGAAVDYSRAAALNSEMQKAVDAAALSLVKAPLGNTQQQLADQARNVFGANIRSNPSVQFQPLTVRREGKIVTVAAAGRMSTAIAAVIGVDAMTVSASASVNSGSNKIEIALVLDNTGSMAESGKMVELKKAIDKFIDTLAAMKTAKDDVRLSIVPFNTQVKLADSNRDARWLRFGVTLENANLTQDERAAPNRKDWAGCLADRDQRYDASAEAPTDLAQTQYVAAKCRDPNLARTQFMTDDLESVRRTALSMQPVGATNVTIGFATGLATLNPDHPFGAQSAKDTSVQKYLVLLTDGDNTQNRWDGTGASDLRNRPAIKQIDKRLQTACAEARKGNVRIFTVKVIEGASDILSGCASDPSMFKDVKNAAEIVPVFDQILKAINATRFTS